MGFALNTGMKPQLRKAEVSINCLCSGILLLMLLCRAAEFIKKICHWSDTGRGQNTGSKLLPPGISLPLGVKGDVKAEISLDVLMCLRLLSEDRELAVQMGSLGF